MREPKHQGNLRTAPVISTRSRHDQLNGVLKKGKVNEKHDTKIQIVKPRKGKVTNDPQRVDPKDLKRIMKRTKKSSAAAAEATTTTTPATTTATETTETTTTSKPDHTDEGLKPTRLPSISKIFGEDLWRDSSAFTRPADPFYNGYATFPNLAPGPLSGPFPLNTIGLESDFYKSTNGSDLPKMSFLRFSQNSGTEKFSVVDGRKLRGKYKEEEENAIKENSKESTVSPDSDYVSDSSGNKIHSDTIRVGRDLLPEVKSKSKVKIEGTHTFQSSQNKKLRKEQPKRYKKIKRWTGDEDKLIIYHKEVMKRSWKDIEALLESKHSWQAIQMRYLRCHKLRNSTWKEADVERLLLKIQEDFDRRNKRILVELGPSFNPKRVATKISELAAKSDDPVLKFYTTDDIMKEDDEEEMEMETEEEDEEEGEGEETKLSN